MAHAALGPSTPACTEEDARELAFLCHALGRLGEATLERGGPDAPRTMRLLALLRAHGPVRVGDVAAFLDLSPSAASRVLRAAEKARLVGRESDVADRRAARVVLTRAGSERLTRHLEAQRGQAGRVLALLPPGILDVLRQAVATLASVAQDDACLHCLAYGRRACTRPSGDACAFQKALEHSVR